MGVPLKKDELAHPGYRSWIATVEALTEHYLGVKLSELPELPYRDGYELGETAAEFYVGAVVEEAEARGLVGKN